MIQLIKKEENWRRIKPKSNVWCPKKGDKIEGVLKEKKENIGQFNANQYVVCDKNDELIIIWGKTQLDQLMQEINIDDYIRIIYNGILNLGDNKQMQLYTLDIKD
ncbi:MAG: hypothetical protein Q4Q23_04175 [Methanobacteriaceae archaeon]|nr:hypothetical protein [Methanobacteriaceae archaeon]